MSTPLTFPTTFPHLRFFKTNPVAPVMEATDRETFETYQAEGLYAGVSYADWVESVQYSHDAAVEDFHNKPQTIRLDSTIVASEDHVLQIETGPDFLGWVQSDKIRIQPCS